MGSISNYKYSKRTVLYEDFKHKHLNIYFISLILKIVKLKLA